MSGSSGVVPDLVAAAEHEEAGEDALAAEVVRRLRSRGYSALQRISCEVEGPVLRLVGRVSSHYPKQLALAIACELSGDRRVVNQIEVCGASRPQDSDRSEFRERQGHSHWQRSPGTGSLRLGAESEARLGQSPADAIEGERTSYDRDRPFWFLRREPALVESGR